MLDGGDPRSALGTVPFAPSLLTVVFCLRSFCARFCFPSSPGSAILPRSAPPASTRFASMRGRRWPRLTTSPSSTPATQPDSRSFSRTTSERQQTLRSAPSSSARPPSPHSSSRSQSWATIRPFWPGVSATSSTGRGSDSSRRSTRPSRATGTRLRAPTCLTPPALVTPLRAASTPTCTAGWTPRWRPRAASPPARSPPPSPISTCWSAHRTRSTRFRDSIRSCRTSTCTPSSLYEQSHTMHAHDYALRSSHGQSPGAITRECSSAAAHFVFLLPCCLSVAAVFPGV